MLKKLVALLSASFLLSCTTPRYVFVKAKSLEEVRAATNCGSDVLPNYGCYRAPPELLGGCKIIVVWPRDTSDSDNLQTLGKELYKCLERSREY